MKALLSIFGILLGTFSHAQIEVMVKDSIRIQTEKIGNQTVAEFILKNKEDSTSSVSTGTVANGGLVNGKLMPYRGENFQYFDSISYMSGRAFCHQDVRKTIVETYDLLRQSCPGRVFQLMECSNQCGGSMFPHQTHQNGLSIDFMMPLQKSDEPFYDLDNLGADHYWLKFDNNGRYEKDKSVQIDFETVAIHLLLLNNVARKYGLKVSKVIIKIELKDELFSGLNGKKLESSDIYVVQKLNPIINNLHDDHFHVDFSPYSDIKD